MTLGDLEWIAEVLPEPMMLVTVGGQGYRRQPHPAPNIRDGICRWPAI